MKISIPSLLASVLLIASPALRAAETAPAPATPPAVTAPAPRPAAENLTPEERTKRRKEAAEKRDAKLKDLRDKKTAGTLSDTEKTQLERLEKQTSRSKNPRRGGGKGGPGVHKPKKSADGKDA